MCEGHWEVLGVLWVCEGCCGGMRYGMRDVVIV